MKKTVLSRGAKLIPKVGPLRGVRRRMNPARRLRDSLREETRQLSAEVFAELQRDDEFWRRFD